MKKNTIVSWLIQGAENRGHGKTISNEDEYGCILVAADYFGEENEKILGYHPVIHCTVTWLTVEKS